MTTFVDLPDDMQATVSEVLKLVQQYRADDDDLLVDTLSDLDEVDSGLMLFVAVMMLSPLLERETERTEAATNQARSFHLVIRQAQAAYAAGLRDGPGACMEWLGNALAGPGNLPGDGADPDWYSEDGWTEGPPWPKPPAANATPNEPSA
jgi:hypothetical protein